MRSKIYLAFLLTFLLTAAVSAQSLTGVFTGVVTDASGAVVPGAAVTITNDATQAVVFRSTTDEQGLYLAPALRPGVYNIAVEAPGYKRAELRAVNLQVDQRARIDVALATGEVSETVTVTGESAGRLERETSAIDEVLNVTQVRNLPLPSRQVLNLLNLVGGVSADGDASSINAGRISINGSRTRSNEIAVDGVSVVNGVTGNTGRMPSTEAIRELRVLTSSYSAEYGRTSGGYINAVVDSGTKDYHGGVFEYFRNEKLNANNFFNNANGIRRPPDRYNQFGGKLGGPLRLLRFGEGGPALTSGERTFFFAIYEGVRRKVPAAPVSTLPDERFRVGDFSASPIVIRDPLTNQPFPGNRIPTERIDPAARNILALLPLPNSTGSPDAANGLRINNYLNSQSNSDTNNEFTTRIDHSFSDAARAYGRFSYIKSLPATSVVIAGPLDPGTGQVTTPTTQLALGYTHALSPTLALELNAGFNRINQARNPPSLGINVPATLGIARALADVTPRIAISGFAGLGVNSNTASSEITNTYSTNGALTVARGAHTLKFGAQLRKNQFNVFNAGGNFAGVYNFNGEITSRNAVAGNPVNALADFLLGQVQTALYSYSQLPTGRRSLNFGLFMQEDWKVTRRLTVNLGLRYDIETPIRDANNLYARVDEFTGKLLVAGKNASETLNVGTDYNNFGPRIGFAWSLDDKTVMRGGGGIFFSPIFQNLGGATNFPGFSRNYNFADLGVATAQPFTLAQGAPILPPPDQNDPFLVERESTLANPLGTSSQFGAFTKLPYTFTFNLGVQRELLGGVIAEASYVGSRGVNTFLSLPYNLPAFARAEELARTGLAVDRQNARQFPLVGGIGIIVPAGSAVYHSLQLKAAREFSRRLSFLSSYTFSKALDDGSSLFPDSAPNGTDVGQFPSLARSFDRGLSSFDRTHNFSIALQYNTPTLRGLGPVSWLLRDFLIAPIVIARSGVPDTVAQSNLHPSATQQRPNLTGSLDDLYEPGRPSIGTAIRYLRAPGSAGFALAPTGPLFFGTGAARRLVLPVGIGTLPRNAIRLPREINLDIAVSRRFPIKESIVFTLRAEAFNALNRTNLNGPNVDLTVTTDGAGNPVFNSPNFGLITSAKSARFFQLVARFEF